MKLANPIIQSELRYQRYLINTNRAGSVWVTVALALMIPAFITSIGVFVAVVFLEMPMPFRVFPAYLPSTFANEPLPVAIGILGILIMLAMNLAQYLVMMLISFGLAANSLWREKTGKTWDILRLTNIDAGRLVMGKFMACLYALRGDHAIIAVLRVGAIAWGVRAFDSFYPPETLITSGHILTLCLLVVIFTLLDAAMNTALTLAALLTELPAVLAFAMFSVLRGGTLLYALNIAMQTFERLIDAPESPDYWLVGGAGVVIYAVLVGAALGAARWLAVTKALVSSNTQKI